VETAVKNPATRRRGRPRLEADTAATDVPRLLLCAGIEQFALHGFEGAGLRQIAAQAQVNAAMIVHHFGSKLGLWEAAIDDLSATLLQGLDRDPGIHAAASPEQRLDRAIAHIIAVICDRPELAPFILREVVLENSRADFSYIRLIKPIHDSVAPIIADYAAHNEAAIDADYLFLALTGAIVSSIAARRLIGRLSGNPVDDRRFREELRVVISAQMAARLAPDEK